MRNDELDTCHAYLNVLHAGLQGKQAMLHILQQLTDECSLGTELRHTRVLLEEVIAWSETLYETKWCVLQVAHDSQSIDLARLAILFEEWMDEIQRMGCAAETILSNAEFWKDIAAVQMLVALLGYHAYARDHYIRGLVRYGEAFERDDIAEKWRVHIPSSQQCLQIAHNFLGQLGNNTEVTTTFAFQLHEETLLLPAIFRCQVHDLNQIRALTLGEFNYEQAGFTPDEADRWVQCGIIAAQAGYWRAYEINPEEVVTWIRYGFIDPCHAGSWRYRGFSASEAFVWAQSGYSPREATIYVGFGCKSPEQARTFDGVKH